MTQYIDQDGNIVVLNDEHDFGYNEDDEYNDYERRGNKKVSITVLLSDLCEEFEVDNIHESLEQSEGVYSIESFVVEGFEGNRTRWGQ